MSNEDKKFVDLGTTTQFVTTYKTIRVNGKTYTIEKKEVVEPELPQKKVFRKGPGRPKKKKAVENMDNDENIDMDKLMDEAMKEVEE